MSAAVSRAERAFDSLTARAGVTQCGADWMKAALDPFHDKLSKIDGFPDTNNSLSVVQVVPVTATISAPSAVSGNWACHIVNMPWLQQLPMNGVSTTAGNTLTLAGDTALQNFGGISCMAVADNNSATQWSPLTYTTAALAANTAVVTNLQVPTTYLVGKNRIIGSGCEVYNTTAEIYRQGNVTCYRSPVPDYEVCSTYNYYNSATSVSGNATYSAVSATRIPCWPVNNNNSLLLRGSRTWKAADGSYQTHALHSTAIPCDNTDFIMPAVLDSNSVLYFPSTSGSAIPVQTSGAVWNTISWPNVEWTKFDMSGAIYTGLSPQTTLLVRWNLYIERFPDSSLSDLVVLSTPSPPYDPKALEAYALAINDMPVGVPVAENGIGDWFGGIVGKIAETIGGVAGRARRLLGAIPHPNAQMLSQVAASIERGGNYVASTRSGDGRGLISPPGNTYIDKPVPSMSRLTMPTIKAIRRRTQNTQGGVAKPFLKRGGGKLASQANKK